MTDIPIKIQFVKSLSTAQPSRIVAVKADGDTNFTLYVTDKNGLPFPLKETSSGIVTAIQNTDGKLVITGSDTKTINVAPALLSLINSALQAGDNVSELVNDASYITLADIPTFVASDYDLEDFTNAGVDPYAHLSDLSTGITNLDYIPSPTQGIVTSDTGSDATIPLADGTNAGLLEPSKYTILENTSGTNTGDQDLQSVLNSGNYAEEDSGESWVEILGGSPHLRHFNAGLYSGAGIDNSTEFFVNPYSINLYNSGTTKEGGLNVDSGELYLYSKNKILNKDTSLYFNTPTESTIINIPAPTIAGTYTLATLDDIPTPIDITGLVPYTGATTDVDLGEHQLKTGQLELDQTPTGTFSTAKIRWNDTAGTAEMRLKGNSVTLQLGQELVKRVVNKTTTNITLQESNYQVVRIIGATGQRLSVDLAQADSEANSASTLGLVTENIANNQEGFITFSGEINLINTTGSLQGETWVDGDVLYLSPTIAGQLTNIEPIAPDRKIRVGYVQYAHATQGKIHVDVDRGYSLENLHNVKITSTTAGKILGSTTEGLWENKTIPDALGFTPENIANKSDSYTTSSSTAYVSGKALVEGLGTKQNTLTNPVTGTGVGGQVSFWDGTNTQTGGNRLLWDNTNSSLEVNGNAPRFTLKNNLNNFSTYFTNNAGGGLALKNHQDKTLAFFTNPVGSTDQPQMAIGNVTSIPTESQLYVYGGINGANIDARGSATVDECNIDLEGNDWTTSPNSLGFSYFGSKATSSGTMLGYPKNKLGIIRFQETNYAIINSEKVAGVSPIRFGINNIEIGNVNDKGFSYQSDFSSVNSSNPRWLADKGYVDTKAPLSSPTFTGTPTAPTAAPGTNTTQIATMAALQTALDSKAPISGSANYIQNQNASAQSANMWISGSANFGTGISTTSLNGKEIQFYNVGVSPAILKVADDATSINSIELFKSGAVANVVVPNGTVTASNGTLIGGTLTSGYIPKATGANSLGNSLIYENSGSVIISSAKNSIGGTVQLDGSWTNGTVFGGDGGDKFLLGNSIFLGGGATLCGANSTLNDFAPVGIIGSYIKFGINADEKMRLNLTGNFLLNTTADDGVNKLQVNGSISATSYTGSATLTGTPTAPTAAPGTTGNQIATTAFVQATRPYKVYTALLSQSGTSAPTAIVLENTLGTVTYGYSATGNYNVTIPNAVNVNKVVVFVHDPRPNWRTAAYATTTTNVNIKTVLMDSAPPFPLNNSLMLNTPIEIRVYN